ncbi:nuclear transport factor 2 family protein [Blastococcus sp. Marseille-P5729]|uniref:nuclear transport factor 2 family protein n=1 Tax=Blastococcus sp. Marseille-P5729 TaxID=2086582 RepID=UPI00131EC1DA|nr:nuclear transport factor 2 family protein [Blastococcus sp. Marseille-P5729]
MRRTIGPYRVGEQVYACSRWALLAGEDTRDGSAVWVRRTHTGPRRGAAARALLGELAESEFIARPVALASDDGALLAIDPVDPEWSPLARSDRLAADAQVRAAYGLASAVDVLHAAGYAHGGIGEWTVDLRPDGRLRLRGAAEAGAELDRSGARRDICAVVAAVEQIAGGVVDPRLTETLTALSAGRAGPAQPIAVTAAILQIEPSGRPVGDQPADGGRRAPEIVASLRGPGRQREPRELPPAPRGPRRPREPRRTPRHAAPAGTNGRTLVGAGMLVIGIVLAIVAIWPRERPPTDAASTITTASSENPSTARIANPDWSTYLPALYETRAEAFTAGDADLLAQVYTPGSAQLRADAETIAALESQEREVRGFAPAIVEVYDVQVDADTATVLLRDEIAPFVIVDATGTEMPVEGRAAAMTTLTMRQVDGAWLIDTAHRAPD